MFGRGSAMQARLEPLVRWNPRASNTPHPPPMPLTCNAFGDVLALMELAIVIAKVLNDCRAAPAECRALA